MTRNCREKKVSTNADPENFQAQFFKTSMCRFQQGFGECRRGASCTFAHRREELRSSPDLRKTSLCRQWQFEGECSNPDCRFAHRMAELNSTSNFFRKKPCTFFTRGRCISGESCRFSHDQTSDNGEFVEIDSGNEQDGSDDATDTERLQDLAHQKKRQRARKRHAVKVRSSCESADAGAKICSHQGNTQQGTHDGNMGCVQIPSSSAPYSSHMYPAAKSYACCVPLQHIVPQPVEPAMVQQRFVHTHAGMQQVMIPICAATHDSTYTTHELKNAGMSMYNSTPLQQLVQLPDGTLAISYFVPVLTPSNARIINGSKVSNQYIYSAPPNRVQWAPQYTPVCPSYALPNPQAMPNPQPLPNPQALPNPQSNSAPAMSPTSPIDRHRYIGSLSYVQPFNVSSPFDGGATSLARDLASPDPEPSNL